MTEQDSTFLYVVFLSFLIFALGFKVYANHHGHQLKALERLHKALEALGALQGKLWRYNAYPTPENKDQFTSEIIAPASVFLPCDDVLFLHDISRKTDTEIKEFSDHIHAEMMRMLELRDRIHVKIYGKMIP